MTHGINRISGSTNFFCIPRMASRFDNGYALGIRHVAEVDVGPYRVRDAYDKPYRYQDLFVGNRWIDSNDPATLGPHMPFIVKAHGSVLISGVGMGGFLYRILRKKNIWHVTVAESSREIITILDTAFADFKHRVTFVNASPEAIVNANVYDGIYHPESTW